MRTQLTPSTEDLPPELRQRLEALEGPIQAAAIENTRTALEAGHSPEQAVRIGIEAAQRKLDPTEQPRVEEAHLESFPASDAPSFTPERS